MMDKSKNVSDVSSGLKKEVETPIILCKEKMGYTEEHYDRPEGMEFYKGNFTNGAYHGFGYYKNDSIFGEKWTYEGSFFSNAKEGYGRLSLADNSYFEGLFKNDQPFGPGVLTMASGAQNVGFWQGSSLVRLIQRVDCDVNGLSPAAASNIPILKFRKLVNIIPPNSTASEIAANNNLPQEKASQLLSIYCQNQNSKLFDRNLFERIFFDDLRRLVKLCQPKPDIEDELKFESPAEDDSQDHENESRVRESNSTIEQTLAWDGICNGENRILAWNNSPIIVDMLVHTFFHQLYENLAGFSVLHLLCNDRGHFKELGSLERASVDLLRSCGGGDLKGFTRILSAYNLNVNVQDNKGNGCVIRAASHDDHSLLYLLFIFGADLNTSNDEGFTALNHTITRYLAVKNDIENWENGFMPPVPHSPQVREWRRCGGITDKSKESSPEAPKSSKGPPIPVQNDEKRDGTGDRYVFDLSPAMKLRKKSTMSKVLSLGSNKSSKKKVSRRTQESEATSAQETEPCSNLKLQKAYETLKILIAFKVDPNASVAPQPAVIQAVFSEDFALMKMLLEAGADPNAKMLPEEGGLTALHALCLAKPHSSFPDMMNALLEYGADPNAQSSVDYESSTQFFLVNGKHDDSYPTVGIKPLEALILRIDAPYVDGNEILKELLLKLHDLTIKEPKYYGHSFLSMAVARANLAFIFTLLHVLGADPNEELDLGLGNICTVCLTYLGAVKDPEAIIAILELEVAGMNPLRIVKTNQTTRQENAIDFAFATLNLKEGKRMSKKHGKPAEHVNVGAERLSTDGKRSTSSARKSRVGSKASHAPMRKSVARKSNASGKSRKRSETGGRASNASLRKSTARKSNASKKGRPSDSRNAKRPNKDTKELAIKVTLLQDMGREKVDKYVRGHVLRRMLRHLREAEHHNLSIDPDDVRVRNLINWFPTEEEFERVLGLNVRAGMAFLSREDVLTIYKLMPWAEPGSPALEAKITAHGDLLSPADKAILEDLKNIIKSQLLAGIDPDRIVIPTKKKKSRSAASPRRTKKSKKSVILSVDDSKRLGDSTSWYPTDLDSNNLHQPSSNTSSATKEDAFLQRLSALLTACAPHVRWAKRYGIKTVKMTKQEIHNTDLYPEVNKTPHLYKVCYKCVRRASKLELCPLCRLLLYCSTECNIQDILNHESNHRCKADFYDRGDKWRQYGFDEDGNIHRIPRTGQKDWETSDISEDGLVKEYGSLNNRTGSKFGTRGKTQMTNAESRQRRSERFSKRSRESVKPHSQRKGSRRETGHRSRDSWRGRPGRSSRQSRGQDKGRGSRNRRRGSGKFGTTSLKRKGKSVKEVKFVGTDKRPLRNKKKLLRAQEVARMRELRQKMPKGIMGDFLRWGQTKKQTLMSMPWYRKVRQDPTGINDSSATARMNTMLARQTQILQDLSRILGPNFDLSSWFPWIVVRNGELYYKIDSTLFMLENYSLN